VCESVEMTKTTLYIVGIDPVHPAIPDNIMRQCSTLLLSRRFAEQFTDDITRYPHLRTLQLTPLAEALKNIEQCLHDGNVVVLATGDPLFFGIGKLLIDRFAQSTLVICPAVSSMQYAFSRFLLPWDDAVFVSMHGRTEEHLQRYVAAHHKIGIVTDGKNTPAAIAARLREFYTDDIDFPCIVHVGENLGLPNECLFTGSLKEVAARNFGSLCCMILVRELKNTSGSPKFGLSEPEILHSRGLITKAEIRAAAIHALAIPPRATIWDIGAGSGSISLEIARLFDDALVYAIEKDHTQLGNIIANRSRFTILNLKILAGEAPAALAGLPSPDRVFIGGSGGRLGAILACCAENIKPGGRIVVTGVLEKTCRTAPEILYRLGFQVETSRIQVHRRSYPDEKETTLNPITIITGMRTP
jgi:precorrin-6B C5,15-methyltransferase / cobalt-precorrin-6B C5,C15-methyltransferase